MDMTRLRQLRDHVASLPDEKFDYTSFFTSDDDYSEWLERSVIPLCGTAGCLAGHCLTLFRPPHKRRHHDVSDMTSALLDLNDNEEFFLFFFHAGLANKADALRRMDWLLEGNKIYYCPYSEPPANYPVEKESWYQK